MRIALLLSGGTGTRVGAGAPKQYREIGGRRLFSYGLETLFRAPILDGVQVVAQPEWQPLVLSEIQSLPLDGQGKFLGFSLPGENRQLSILHGLRDILKERQGDAAASPSEDIVLIQDAARPLTTAALVGRCIEAVETGHEGAVPVLPMKDTVYQSEDGERITGLLEREKLFSGQAPEAFRLGKYLAAVEALLPDRILSIRGSAEPAFLAGMDIALIPGEESNFKITTQEDVERFRQILAGAEESSVKAKDKK